MKTLFLLLITLFASPQLKANDGESRPFSVFNALLKDYSAHGFFSKGDLSRLDALNTSIDKINNLACTLSDDKSMLFFVYPEQFGVPKHPMKSGGRIYISVGTSMTGRAKPEFIKLQCVTNELGKSSFRVEDKNTRAAKVVEFHVDHGMEKFSWRDVNP